MAVAVAGVSFTRVIPAKTDKSTWRLSHGGDGGEQSEESMHSTGKSKLPLTEDGDEMMWWKGF